MSGLYHIAKRWIQQLRAQRTKKQQWNDAGETELRSFARASTDLKQDAGLDPFSTRAEAANVSQVNTTPRTYSSLTRYTTGFRFSALSGAVAVSIVFLINLIATMILSARKKDDVMFDGDCDRASQLNAGLHLLINLLSTVLLSASNYCMQCLSAPTRKEVDDAHSKGKWLDIGVQSVHNLRSIGNTDWKRAVVWCLLGVSSLPLHLFYNSAVFLSISSNDYYAVSVRESFINSPECAECAASFIDPTAGPNTPYYSHNLAAVAATMYEKAHGNKLDRLSNIDCIQEYAKPIQTKRRNVLLVTADDKMPSPNRTDKGTPINIYAYNTFVAGAAEEAGTAMSLYDWICSNPRGKMASYWQPCAPFIDDIKRTSANWAVSGRGYNGSLWSDAYPVDYCLSEKSEPRCKVQFTLPIAILVTVLNFFKAVLIFYTALGTKEDPLLTMGDAVASFLERRDETTKGMCLLSARDVKKYGQYFPAGPRAWTGERRRFKDVTSRTRRTVTFVLLGLSVIFPAFMFGWGVHQLPNGASRSFAGLISLGYGAIDASTIMKYESSLSTIGYIILANLAQPVLSFIYFSYNGLFTAMFLGYEWVSYAHQRKGLRVSRPAEGAQRSTYFLQLPYRFALPLMGLSGVLHWLVSQSIFLVAVDVYTYNGAHVESTASRGDFKSTGYSPIAIFTTLIMAIFMTAAAIGIGFTQFKKGMNVAGSCSAAISAACFLMDDEKGFDAARGEVQWGVVAVNADGVGHCAFSTKEVEMPKVGNMYAGQVGARKRRPSGASHVRLNGPI